VVEELALIAEHGVGDDVDDGPDEVVAVFEVVVELAAARAGAGARGDFVVYRAVLSPACERWLRGGRRSPACR
jgi:hypothetical protein